MTATGGVTPAVLTDFDDTAAAQNVAELLLERFGHDGWRDVRQNFRDGRMSLKEYQEVTFREIRAGRDAMREYVMREASLRPRFGELWNFCRERGFPMAVVSQGLDFYIEALLEKEGFPQVPVYAVNTAWTDGSLTYHYHYTRPGHEEAGNSKGLVVDRFREQGHCIFYAGDGASDLEGAERADMVFAHRTLAQQCRERGIPFRDFRDFGDVLAALQEHCR